MQRALYASGDHGLYHETAPSTGNPFAYVWPHSRALIGTLALAGMPPDLLGGLDVRAAVKNRIDALAWYWDGRAYASYVQPPYGNGGDRYSDDNTWVGLALVQAHRMNLSPTAGRSGPNWLVRLLRRSDAAPPGERSGEMEDPSARSGTATGGLRAFPLGPGGSERSEAIRRAQQVFRYLLSQWDRNARDERPGGLFWVQQGVGFGLRNHDRGAGSTAGAAELGLHLQALAGEANALVDEMLAWIERHLDTSATGVGPFLNAVRQDGSIDTNVWSYNQGVMLGAYVLKHRLSGNPTELQRARAIARQSLATFGDFTSQPPSFNAMCFQNLLMLDDPELQPHILDALANYADWSWAEATRARDPATNLFYFTDSGRPNVNAQPARLQDQGALVQLYALLAWEANQYANLT